jgi:hypothetical protein
VEGTPKRKPSDSAPDDQDCVHLGHLPAPTEAPFPARG